MRENTANWKSLLRNERLRSVQEWPSFLRVDEVIKFKLESSVYLWKLHRNGFFFIENGKEQFFRMLDML